MGSAMALFDDGKDAGALRTIGEVSAALGIRTHVLRYWEEQFSGLKPLKRAGGRRLYRPDDVALIQRIDRLVNREGYTLKGAKAALKGSQTGQDTVEPALTERHDDRGDLLRRLKAIRAELATALAA
jgi:DNA-binding transcriptional MerR regulator